MQRKLNEKRKVALITIVSITLTFCFLANNGSNWILSGDPENFNDEHENYFELLNTANPTNLDFIESIFDAKNNDYAQKGYYPQIYQPSLQATYYALSVLNSIGNLSEINQSKLVSYVMSHYNSSSHQFEDLSAKRYLSSIIPGLYLPLTTLLEVNCYAVLSLDILNALSLIDTAETIDFIWDCYHPTLHGFIGQPYDLSLDEGFKIPTADNTYYAVITLDLLMSDWSSYSQERNDIINFIDGLQSLGSHTGFFNDKNHMFDSLLEIEPNQFASFYAIKTLETFGSSYVNVINIAKFHQDLTDLYHPDDFYFDISSLAWLPNYTNIVATAINLELSDITGFTGFDRTKVIDFIIDNRNALGGWDASTTIKYHEFIDTFQILRSLANTGAISELVLSAKNEIAWFIKLFSRSEGYSLLSEDYTSVELIHTIISSYDYFDRIADLDIQGLYNLLESSALYMGGGYEFFACTKLDPNIPSFRSKPLDYYTLGYHEYVDEINVMYSHKETYSILNSLQKIFKLNDFAAFCDLNSVLQEVTDSQFLDPNYQENYGAFLHDSMFSSSEWKNKLIYLKYSFYAIKVMELIADYLGLGPITNLGFNKTALASYIEMKVVETPSELYFDLKYSDKVEDRLENLYYAIYALKAIDQFNLNSTKIENFAVNNLNYSNIKSLYYCYKISQILDLEIAFDAEQSQSLIQSIYSDTYNEFYLSTSTKRIDQEALAWVCEMAKNDRVRMNAQYSPSVALGGVNTISAELCNIILSDFGLYVTVKLESVQLGTIVFDQTDNKSYQKDIVIPTDPENYPVITGNITAYDGIKIIGQIPISFNTTFDSSYEVSIAKTYLNITITVNASLLFAEGAEPVYDGNVSAKMYREGAYIGLAEFSSEDFANYTCFNLTYKPNTIGNYSFETYLENGYNCTPQLLNYTTYSYEYNPPGNFLISSDAGSPDEDGNFNLEWTSSDGANNYSAYQYSSYITEINGSLTLLLEEVATLSLPISGYSNGTYYFVAVAFNDFGNEISNCINVTVAIPQPPDPPDPPDPSDPPGNFAINSNANDPNENGNFTLEWTSSEGANNYTVYQYSRYIAKINDSLAILVVETEDLSFALIGYSNGTYYFIAVAFNDCGNCTSNCIEITVVITPPSDNDPPIDDPINDDPPNNDPINDDPNSNYIIETSTIALLAIGSIGVPAGTIVALRKVRFAKKTKKSALNN